MINDPVYLSTAYFPPVQYVSKFILHPQVIIEKHENYQKQSYRNRCYLYGANGTQCLVIPVVKHHGEKTPIADVEIDYTMPWQKTHLKSIESAYRLSAFYEYYADDFNTLFNSQPAKLFDWNRNALEMVLHLLKINTSIACTTSWKKELSRDFRFCISPKKRLEKPDETFNPIPYQQVFEERSGFLPNLSIIDLMFNEGPAVIDILKACLV